MIGPLESSFSPLIPSVVSPPHGSLCCTLTNKDIHVCSSIITYRLCDGIQHIEPTLTPGQHEEKVTRWIESHGDLNPRLALLGNETDSTYRVTNQHPFPPRDDFIRRL